TVSLNGNVLGSWIFNGAAADGEVGVLTRSGTTSFDRFEIMTDDAAFVGTAPQPPELRVGDASVSEGTGTNTTATITLSLNGPASVATSIHWATADGSAVAGSDYLAGSGTVTFAAGATTAQITVTLLGDAVYEPNETFKILLSNPIGLNLADGTGVVTILNDDRGLSVGNATITEGDTGTSTVNVTITLLGPATSTVTVTASTVAGSAQAVTDFQAKTQTLTCSPGVT